MEITQASHEWATRPFDERHASLPAMHAVALEDRVNSTLATVKIANVKVGAETIGAGKAAVRFAIGDQIVNPTAHAFEQFCRLVGAPPGYLQSLPAGLAVDNLKHGQTETCRTNSRDYSALLTERDGETVMRAITSTDYVQARVWDEESVRVLMDIGGGWRLPPARPTDYNSPTIRQATEADILAMGDFGLSVNVGDLIDNAGAYRGDRDFFTFLVNPERNFDDGNGNPISRAIMFWGSEVGARSIGFRACGFKHVCGNHILWDAQDILHVRQIHRGANVRKVFEDIKKFLATYTDSSTSREEVMIAAARTKKIADSKEDVIKRVAGITHSNKKIATDAYDRAEQTYDVHRAFPGSFWGMVEGLTYIAQREPNADKRVAIDSIGGKLLAMVK